MPCYLYPHNCSCECPSGCCKQNVEKSLGICPYCHCYYLYCTGTNRSQHHSISLSAWMLYRLIGKESL